MNDRIHLDENLALSLIGSRGLISADVILQSFSEKNKYNMSVCRFVDNSIQCLETLYLSEPILSEGSFFASKAFKMSDIISKLSSSINIGYIDAGKAGELTVRIILLLAFDKLRKDELSNFTLKKYLEALIGKTNTINLFQYEHFNKENLSVLMKGKVFFNHFIELSKEISHYNLFAVYKRCAAIICQTGQKYVDLIIPVLINDEEQVTSIFIQVKNLHDGYNKTADYKRIFTKMNPTDLHMLNNHNCPFMSILIELGEAHSKSENRLIYLDEIIDINELSDYLKKNMISFFLRGIDDKNYPFLKKLEKKGELINELKRLCQPKLLVEEHTKKNKDKKSFFESLKY